MVAKLNVNPVTLQNYDDQVPVSGANPLPVTLVDTPTVNLTGDVVLDTFGALDDPKVVDPDAASATIPALLRGMLEEMQAQTALLTTMSGLLDDIKTNTTPAP